MGGEKMASVKLKNVYKRYEGGVTAVSDFNLDIEDKEFIILVGPSGCGKTTTLRMIAGLEDISEGELYIGDKLVNDVPPKDRDIAMVFQNYALYPHMSVYENMAFALKLRKEKKEVIDEKVKQAAEILGITELLSRKPKALSGGQRQRVAIGRAIVREPQVFLMDEPLSNLDAKLRNQMRAEIIKLRQRINTTFIYVTHDQTEAMTLGDRIVVMKDGFIQQIGTPHEVFNQPANLFVAGFIGTPQMNFFDSKLTLESGKYVVKVFGASFELPGEKQKALSERKQQAADVKLGVRPEHVEIVIHGFANSVKAKVDVSEMMGSEMFMHLDIGGNTAVIRVQDPELLQSYSFDAGRENYVSFTFNPVRIHVFGKETGINLFA
jgi:multiple sugar transport system ATP-binding protein